MGGAPECGLAGLSGDVDSTRQGNLGKSNPRQQDSRLAEFCNLLAKPSFWGEVMLCCCSLQRGIE
jgi:hypothetical protein